MFCLILSGLGVFELDCTWLFAANAYRGDEALLRIFIYADK